MGTGNNYYKADLRDYKFLFFEQFQLDTLLGQGELEDWGKEEVETVLDGLYQWSCDVLGPLNGSGDRQGCRIENGRVITPDGFAKAWKEVYKNGWRELGVPPEHGGQGGPYSLYVATDEIQSGANTSFAMYPGLSEGVLNVVLKFGTEEQIKKYAKPLISGKASGTMCLTEPNAGSDVGSNRTKAEKIEGTKYKITGTKIFISAGDNDFTDNVFHLVLARTAEAPVGTKGLSLFMVPRLNEDGSDNDVAVGSIEHKMGINASATCVVNFGEGGNCVGELVGTEEEKGIRQMFLMMNHARIGVGTQSLSVASSAYFNALEYAKERKQGASIKNWKDPAAPRVPIIEHPDVRRMLLSMKSRVDGLRSLLVKLTTHTDHYEFGQLDDAQKAYHKGQVDLLVPLVKAWGSDEAFDICSTAIQVFGGAGYTQDYPVEQYCRDAKIMAIYEGTNHIQALDLVGRKLGQKGGANFQAYMKDFGAFIAANKDNETFASELAELQKAQQAVGGCAMQFLGWFQSGEMALVPLSANRFLKMFAETTVGWLLLEGAVIAQKGIDAGTGDKDFYEGRIASARFFAHNILPTVANSADILRKADRSCLEISDAAFGKVS